jgi:hypothetical protein
VHLSFSYNEIDSHIVARLGRLDKRGVYRLLSIGTIRPACRRIDADRSASCEIAIDTTVSEPLIPGRPVGLVFSLTPGPTRLVAGEKLASRMDLLRSGPEHRHARFDMPVPPYFSRNTIHFGPETFLELYRAVPHSSIEIVPRKKSDLP